MIAPLPAERRRLIRRPLDARTVRQSLLVLLLLGSGVSASATELLKLTPQQIAEGWISLFDGETLYGWQPTSNANWKVEEGAIIVSEGDQGFLMTTSEFADYELHVEFKAPATTNSGVFLRTPLAPTEPARDCYELNIAPRDNPFPTASLVGRLKVSVAPQPSKSPAGAPTTTRGPRQAIDAWDGQWHSFDVVVDRAVVRISLDGALLDGVSMPEDHPEAPARGRIGLQFREGPVAFRNIRLKPLNLQPMLNGRDLAGWNTRNAESSKFEIVTPTGEANNDSSGPLPLEGRAGEGREAGASSPPVSAEIKVTNGRGILETDAQYGDFIMQLDCYVDGDGLNSGVFFRSIPGEFANGYESQIQNAVKDGDPTKPVDAGTGAIYRRTTARRVVSKDREWFTKTIVATGPHIAVWVNGYQVTDWSDDRPPHANPRSGLRTAPGTISLQGHDPTTNLRFRNLRIAELPAAAE